MNKILWIVRIVPTLILLQTLFFKFTAATESVYIFSTLGLEPHGRIGIGILELIASVLLLIPSKTWMGAVLGFGLMAGAIFSHLTQLGIEVQGDGGYLFILALVVLVCCGVLILVDRKRIPILNRLFN
ncbi:MAG: DoxX family protein [Bacteroidota bacterium]